MRRCRASISGTAVSLFASSVPCAACWFHSTVHISLHVWSHNFGNEIKATGRFHCNPKCCLSAEKIGLNSPHSATVEGHKPRRWSFNVGPPELHGCFIMLTEWIKFLLIPSHHHVSRKITWGEVAPPSGTLSCGGASVKPNYNWWVNSFFNSSFFVANTEK